MGLFDIFKKNSPAPGDSLYFYISRYNDYIVRFISMQQQGNYSPIAAYEKPDGGIIGFLYLMGDDNSYSLSAAEVIKKMEEKFEDQLNKEEIRSYTIFYHSQFNNDDNHQIANADHELKAITMAYHFKSGPAGKIGLPYRFDKEEISYQPIAVFSEQENNSIFKTQLKQGVNYFQHTEKMEAPMTRNNIGLTIKKSNNLDLSNTWCGIFGFESYRKPGGSKVLEECFALAMVNGQAFTKGAVTVSSLHFSDVSFKAVQQSGKAQTILPVIKTDYVVPVENKEINEWENVNNLEAVVTGSGRDTFGISYFATDYAVNRELYLSQKKLNIKLSGIVFVLDLSKKSEDGDMKLADDFTAYMPNKDLPGYGCFDFIGLLEDFKETSLLPDKSLKGYILKVRLINNPEIKDFFTIDMYVTPENMRFTELSKGMKITGMFQLLGEIAEG